MNIDDFIERISQPTSLHSCLYHFTDSRNLPSIRKYGLLSMRELTRRKILVPAPGGNDWSHEADQARGLDQYIHLCLTDQHPMEFSARMKGHITNPVFLQIAPEVIRTQGVMMTKEVSNKSGALPVAPEQLLDEIDLQVIYERTDWKDSAIKERLKIARKHEVLERDYIPLNLIKNL